MFLPNACIDILFDYLSILNDGPLCKIPETEIGTEVAIIGAGSAGLIAAYELLKMGITPIIYEATDRIGGRLYSKEFESLDEKNKIHAELGAMRIPKSSAIFLYYAKKFGISCDNIFPGPGIVNTDIFYRNKLYHSPINTPLPPPFDNVSQLWKNFIDPIVSQISHSWQAGNIEDVKRTWQIYIKQYQNKSFYEVLRERSYFITTESLNIFSSVGAGIGGFGALFQVDFLEVLRMLVNGYLKDQLLLTHGVSEFIEKIYTAPIKNTQTSTSLKKNKSVYLNTPVIQLDYNPKTQNPIVIFKHNNIIQSKEYKAIIFTGSTFAAQLINVTNKTKSGYYLIDANARNAIRHATLMPASKTYICTEDKFWKNKNIPRCLLTDDLTRATYFLDYPQTKHGVICLSYTWNNDATKMHAVDPLDRVKIFKRVIKAAAPNIEKYLQPLNNEVISIDWANMKYQNGAFNIFSPGNNIRQKSLYYQFLSCLSKETDHGFYLAGDGISWSGGWVEGALYTSINAVFAVAKRLGANMNPNNPLNQDKHLFDYT